MRASGLEASSFWYSVVRLAGAPMPLGSDASSSASITGALRYAFASEAWACSFGEPPKETFKSRGTGTQAYRRGTGLLLRRTTEGKMERWQGEKARQPTGFAELSYLHRLTAYRRRALRRKLRRISRHVRFPSGPYDARPKERGKPRGEVSAPQARMIPRRFTEAPKPKPMPFVT